MTKSELTGREQARDTKGPGRRQFLQRGAFASAAIGAAAMPAAAHAAGAAANLPPNVPAWMQAQGAGFLWWSGRCCCQ